MKREDSSRGRQREPGERNPSPEPELATPRKRLLAGWPARCRCVALARSGLLASPASASRRTTTRVPLRLGNGRGANFRRAEEADTTVRLINSNRKMRRIQTGYVVLFLKSYKQVCCF